LAQLHRGIVDVTEHVVSFQKRRNLTAQVLGEVPLDLPPQTLRTQATWWTVPHAVLTERGIADIAGCVHAAEHAAIGLLPLFTMCDRNDIGGVSMAEHPDTGQPTVFVYDGYTGGAGFTWHGFAVATEWLSATRETIISCTCTNGCPGCVQSPKCGNNNHPLDKAAAAELLTCLVSPS
jgi:DEAD/DEAH box helicase domain-containing protein